MTDWMMPEANVHRREMSPSVTLDSELSHLNLAMITQRNLPWTVFVYSLTTGIGLGRLIYGSA